MRRHPKASAVGPSLDPWGNVVRAGATGFLATLTIFVALLSIAPMAQAKVVVGAFGPAGTQGGQFGGPGGRIAINNSGVGGVPAGTVYVTDTQNHRVQRLTPTGGFERAWGFDVDSTNPSTGFEICTNAANCKQGITTTATANGGLLTSPEGIDVNQATGHVYVVDNGNRRVEEFDADGNFVRAWGADVLVGGVTTFEICSVASECKSAAVAGTNGGQLGNNPRSLRLDSAGNVWVADTANRRLQKFESSGGFIAAYGFNVNNGGALESCISTAAGVCKAGTAGSGPGQFTGFSPFHVDFDSAGNLLANNGGNQRIERFVPAMTTAATFAALPLLDNTGAILVLPGDHLLVTENQSGERQLVELDQLGVPVETSLVGLGLTAINGLARQSATGRIYATTPNSQAKVMIIEDGSNPPPPGMTVDPVTIKTATTANFNGSIDPQGATISNCSFQYSTSESFSNGITSVAVSNCSSLAPGGGAQAVAANATGLVPNTKYFVRLAVNRLFVPGTSLSVAQSFTTDAVVPVVSNVGAANPGDTSARFVATIDPRNSGEVAYVFEYGTTPALGLQTDPVQVANGNGPIVVSQVVQGLSPATQYYLRVIATNATGSSQSTTVTFTTRGDPLPGPDGRAYEMVSPVDKNGGGALSGDSVAVIAPLGDAAGFCTTSAFGDPPGPQSFLCVDYVSHRTPSGWRSHSAVPRYCRTNFEQPGIDSSYFFDSQRVDFSQNLDYATLGQPENDGPLCAIPPLDPAAPLPQKNLYLESLTGDDPDYQLLAPAQQAILSGPSGGVQGGAQYLASSDDFSHIVYSSNGQQTADAAPSSALLQQVYEWDNGTLRLVSKDLSGNALTSSSAVPGDGVNGVSADGNRIFFQAPSANNCGDANCELYMRKGGSNTYHVSQSECTSSCGSSAADGFLFASPDGSKVFFRSDAKLTDDTPASTASFDPTSKTNANLYLYTDSADPASNPNNLTLLTKDNEPADGINANVLAVLGVSGDGNIAYLVAEGQMVPGRSIASGPKVYRWSWNDGSPSVDYLATLSAVTDKQNWVNEVGNSVMNRLVTADGKYLALETTLTLDSVADTDSDMDIYRWDAAAGWTCVSCQVPGAPSAGDSSFKYQPVLPLDVPRSAQRRIVMTDDGQRIFFDSTDALVPEDVNGQVDCPDPITANTTPAPVCKDAYEWHDGRISLLSTGSAREPIPTVFLGASADGRDAFIYTVRPLVGWDTDAAGDIYDARIGGGFPEPPPTGAPCEGDACRGAASPPAESTGAGTAAFQGPGNPAAVRPKPRKHRRHKRAKHCRQKEAKQHPKRAQHRGSCSRNANTNRRAGK